MTRIGYSMFWTFKNWRSLSRYLFDKNSLGFSAQANGSNRWENYLLTEEIHENLIFIQFEKNFENSAKGTTTKSDDKKWSGRTDACKYVSSDSFLAINHNKFVGLNSLIHWIIFIFHLGNVRECPFRNRLT